MLTFFCFNRRKILEWSPSSTGVETQVPCVLFCGAGCCSLLGLRVLQVLQIQPLCKPEALNPVFEAPQPQVLLPSWSPSWGFASTVKRTQDFPDMIKLNPPLPPTNESNVPFRTVLWLHSLSAEEYHVKRH